MQVNKQIVCFLFLGVTLLLSACFHKELKEEDYVAWVQDYNNGLHKKKQVGGYTFDLQYKPADYALLGEISTSENIEETRQNLSPDMHYFTLKLSNGKDDFLGKGANQQEAMARIYYYSYGFQQDIRLKEGDKEIPCELYHFERSYDMTPTRTFVLGFPKTNSKDIEDLILEMDCHERGLGLVKIKIEKSVLEAIPSLKI